MNNIQPINIPSVTGMFHFFAITIFIIIYLERVHDIPMEIHPSFFPLPFVNVPEYPIPNIKNYQVFFGVRLLMRAKGMQSNLV
jgi:hypothetical protein